MRFEEMHEVFYEDFLSGIEHTAEKERRRKKFDERENYKDVKFSRSKTQKKRRKIFDFSSYDEDEI